MANERSWQILRVSENELPLLRELLICFGRAFDELDTYTARPPSDDYLIRLLAKPDFYTVVALADNKVVAGLAAYQLEKFEQQRSEIYIYDLAVDEGYRRQGIATELIVFLKELGKSVGVYEVFVQADYVDEPAVALYTSLGMREEVLHFSMAVE